MAYFHQRIRTRIRTRIRIPNPIVTLYYAQLFSTGSDLDSDPCMDNFPNGYCTHFRDIYLSQGQISIPIPYIWIRGSESDSEPVEKSGIVQESESESESSSGNNDRLLYT